MSQAQVDGLLNHRPGEGVLDKDVVDHLFYNELAINFVDQPNYAALSERYRIPVATLHSIRSQVLMDIVLRRNHVIKEHAPFIVSSYYLDGESLEGISRKLNFAPIVVLNNLLESPVLGGIAFNIPVEKRNEIKADPDRTLFDPDTWATGALRFPDFLPSYPPLPPALPAPRGPKPLPHESEEETHRTVHAMLRRILLRVVAEEFVQEMRPQLQRLRDDVRLAFELDAHHGTVKANCRDVGALGESKLYAALDRLGVYYLSEDQQRAKYKELNKSSQGEKTPDARLPVPLLVKGRPVFWIDSKADFGSNYMHSRNLSQLSSYTMRFKQGLVIYWYGYDRSIENRSPDILVLDHLPTEGVLQLPHVPLPYLPPFPTGPTFLPPPPSFTPVHPPGRTPGTQPRSAQHTAVHEGGARRLFDGT